MTFKIRTYEQHKQNVYTHNTNERKMARLHKLHTSYRTTVKVLVITPANV